MYTILVNDDLSLTTSVRTPLLHDNIDVNQIAFLWRSPQPLEDDSSDSEEESDITVEYQYNAVLCADIKGVIHTEQLVTDPEPYKDRTRFMLMPSSVFFRNKGIINIWLEITTQTITTVIGEDPVTDTSTSTFTTLPTTVVIESVGHRHMPCPKEDGNVIRITRGDSLSVTVALTDSDGYEYEPVEGDIINFTVKKSASATETLIEKQIDIETLTLELVEADTRDLAFGEYKYEIEVVTVSSDHYTVIRNAPFIIMEELH